MTKPPDISAKLAIDTQSLERLRAQAKHSPDQALKAAAQQFESVFLNMMLKSMREATPQDGMFDSEQTKMFTGMLDQQLAQSMSSRGVGLADIMVKQLRGQAVEAGGSGPNIGAPSSIGALPSAYNEVGLAGMGEFSPNSQNTQQDFVDRMLPFAVQAGQTSGVPPQLMLGQAALESGWGKREIRMADGSNSFNLFGIKANGSWSGKVAEVMTTEYKNGVAHKQIEKFRAYSSYAEAFQDYAGMISGNPRYAVVLQQSGNIRGMAHALQDAGYATDPQYADKLARVMGQMTLKG
ncbi:MAG: flagellar rod assembly protein/muramidase FlgJ [Gallionellales bacterium RIFCSPLOWO2_12_FULL_59_22]|nr:MAG: flagellar rod assembly protein/muramidase FlgJ [Gallionellales bacterium RIFCSPLOWO2_02_FULL_59_110]OGT03942.1 MAG: flagellar rod assembly protein/muramidase FlgJ [Gallionellales bacterium RIFCSPLOWO2_02_58_13]OGT10614.1 MAG: flagellar rod assembly protein/muramidase FlgJ [Gallionellales bacterium RIFCSPLOWO2_12_FULL_59_22]